MMYIVCTVSAPARDIQIIFGTVCQTSGPSIGRQIWTNTFVSAPARRYSDYFGTYSVVGTLFYIY